MVGGFRYYCDKCIAFLPDFKQFEEHRHKIHKERMPRHKVEKALEDAYEKNRWGQ